MLTLCPTKQKRVWDIQDSKDKVVYTLNLSFNSLSNKFSIVKDLIDELNKDFSFEYEEKELKFSDYFEKLVLDYINNHMDAQMLYDNKDIIYKISKDYVKSKNVDFAGFYSSKKRTKTSIAFEGPHLESIAVSSVCLKLYSMFCYDNSMKPPRNLHRSLFEFFTKECQDNGTIERIFQLIQARTYSSYLKDKYLWDLCVLKSGETPDNYIMTIFIYLMTNLFSILDPKINPIPFLNQVVDKSINWLLRTIHTNRVIYGDVFGGTESIYGTTHSQHSLLVYTCNDVIVKTTEIVMQLLKDGYPNLEYYSVIQDRVEKIDEIYPYMRVLALPIISKVLEIPYKHLLSVPPKHCMYASLFMSILTRGIIEDVYPRILTFLYSCPRSKFSSIALNAASLGDYEDSDSKKSKKTRANNALQITKSAYRIKNEEYIINNPVGVFGFHNSIFKSNIFSCICGILSASKNNLVSVYTGKELLKFKLIEIEKETVEFFGNLYSGKMEDAFTQMRNKADQEYF